MAPLLIIKNIFLSLKRDEVKHAVSNYGKTQRGKEHRPGASCYGSKKRVSAGEWLSGVLVCRASGVTGQCGFLPGRMEEMVL